jgi:phosphoribosylamine---glycine ligase
MKILTVGSGGREHALLWALRETSNAPLELICAPGNAGIAQIGRCVPIKANDVNELANYCVSENVNLTIVGPEAPLAAGIVDVFQNRGLKIVGPQKHAAQLEASKAFAKKFMERHKIPTAKYRIASSASEAMDILRSSVFAPDNSVVVKADGLAAGKGVIVAGSRKEAEAAVQDLTSGSINPESVQQIVIEEALSGSELSLLLFSDSKDFRLMPAARDHKRLGDNDTGPNTGGMGSITDANILSEPLRERIVKEIVGPTLEGAGADGFPFRGILFIGLMITDDGPKVLEYNVRFGDPETQAILVRLRSDLAEICESICSQCLGEIKVNWSDESSACVVLAARGYPGKPETGARITGLDRASDHQRISIFHAATARDLNGEWLTAGGRVLGVTATGENLQVALSRCYEAVADIAWDGLQYRRDIGRAAARVAR